MSTILDYALVDVFAETPLEGNQLAIFPDATGLNTQQMQALARETNLSETTFILPRDPAIEAREGVRVRIFLTTQEVPFAGHPTLGTAAWLHLHHPTLAGAPRITLALDVGPIPVDFPSSSGPGVYASMRQRHPTFGDLHAPAEVAAILGLDPTDLDLACPPQTVSTGMPFCVVLLRSVQALARLHIPQHAAEPWLAARGIMFFYCLAAVSPGVWRARMQFFSGEDPATGSAAGCAAAWLVRQQLLPSATPGLIHQGQDIHRPSRITIQATRSTAGNIEDVFVSGRTIPVASGRFFLP